MSNDIINPEVLALTNGLEQSVMPSPNIVSVHPSHKEQHLTRLGSHVGTAAERYLLESRVRPWEVEQLASPASIEMLRKWFFDSERVFDEGISSSAGAPAQMRVDTLPDQVAQLLSIFGSDGQLGPSLFAADLTVIAGDAVLGLAPMTDRLVSEHRIDSDVTETLRSALPEWCHEALENCVAVLAFSVVPARYGVLMGDRGLRRALLEVGTLLTNTAAVADAAGLAPMPVIDFSDVVIDRLLRNDGVERTTAALLILGAQPGDSEPADAQPGPAQPEQAQPGPAKPGHAQPDAQQDDQGQP